VLPFLGMAPPAGREPTRGKAPAQTEQANRAGAGSAKRAGAAAGVHAAHKRRCLRGSESRTGETESPTGGAVLSDGASSDRGTGDSEWSESYSESYSDSEAGMCHGVCQDCGCEGKVFVEPGETMDPEWWDARFRGDIDDGTTSEWVSSYDGIAHFMLPSLDAAGRTLVVGCGNSDFSELLCTEAGFTDIVNTDISKVVIDHMRKVHAENKAMTWVVDNAVSMGFDDCAFDQIVDKSLLDCLCHCDDPEFEGCVNDFVRECHRVLRPGGVAIFATKQSQDELERHMPCAGKLECRWCELDWTITRKVVHAPAGDTTAVAVEDPKLLPADCEEFDTIFIFSAVKGGKAARQRGREAKGPKK